MTSSPPPTSEDPPTSTRGLILATVLATAVVRALIAYSRLDELELERYSASFGWALLNGVDLNPEKLPIIPHLRGSAVFGVLLMPLMAVGGPTLFMVKTLAILFSCLSSGLVAHVAARVLGLRAGICAALLIVLGPPAFQMVDVLALGSHADTIPFVLAPLAILLAGAPGTPLSNRAYALIGALLGAGLFFSMQVWVAFPALLAAWWCRDRRFLLRPGIGLTALAAAPLIALVPVVTRSATLVNRSIEDRFVEGGPAAVPGKFLGSIVGDLPQSWLYHSNGVGWAGVVLAVACGLGGLLALVRFPWKQLLPGAPAPRREHALALYSLLHVAALLGAYSISDFRVNLEATLDGMGSRYFFPILPALLFLVAAALRGLPRGLGNGALAVVLAVGVAGVAPLIDLSVGRGQPTVLATEIGLFHDHLVHDEPDDLEARFALVDRVDPNWPHARPLLHNLTFAPVETITVENLPALLAEASRSPAPIAEFRLSAIGFFGAQRAIEGGPMHLDGIESRLLEFLQLGTQATEGDACDWFLRGVGRQLTQQQGGGVKRMEIAKPDEDETKPVDFGFDLLRKLPAPYRGPALEGMGFQLGMRATPYERLLMTIMRAAEKLAPQFYDRYYVGFGWGFRSRFVESSFDPTAPLTIEAVIGPRAAGPFRRGLAWRGSFDGDGR